MGLNKIFNITLIQGIILILLTLIIERGAIYLIRLTSSKKPDTQIMIQGSDPKRNENGKKPYTIILMNRGKVLDKNIKVSIRINGIDSVNIDNENRIQIIRGGHNGFNLIEMKVDELFPNEIQLVKLFANPNTDISVDAWSSITGKIESVGYRNITTGEPYTPPIN